MKHDSIWWGGADYRVGNITPWGSAKKVVMTFDYPLFVYESWYPFFEGGFRSMDGAKFSTKWEFELLSGSTGVEFGILVKHEFDGPDHDINILMLEYCD